MRNPTSGTLAIQRSIRSMTIGSMNARERRRLRDLAEALAELDQQFQLPVAGGASDAPVWFSVEVSFSAKFVSAPEMRESPYDEPLFTYGSVTAAPVFINCNVIEWKTDENDSYIGAVVNIGVIAPGSPVLVPFKGEVHLNFQGFGAVDESDSGTED